MRYLVAATAAVSTATLVAAQAGFSSLPYSFITPYNHSCAYKPAGRSCPEANPMQVSWVLLVLSSRGSQTDMDEMIRWTLAAKKLSAVLFSRHNSGVPILGLKAPDNSCPLTHGVRCGMLSLLRTIELKFFHSSSRSVASKCIEALPPVSRQAHVCSWGF